MVCESLGQHGSFIKQLAEPGSGVFVWASVVLSACPLICSKFSLWLQLQIQRNKPEWKGLCASVPGKAVLTQPICESQTLCNSLPLSRERMYLSNHLNYYNHCWNGNAWISALTLWNFQGRWKYASLTFGVFAKQNYALWNVAVQTHGIESKSTNWSWAWLYFINTHRLYRTQIHMHKPALCSLHLKHRHTPVWSVHIQSINILDAAWMTVCLNLCCYHQYTTTILHLGHISFVQNNDLYNLQCRFFISHTSKTVLTENLEITQSYNLGF